MSLLSERIKELRIKKGYNMRQMATALNLPYTTYATTKKAKESLIPKQLS